MNNLFVGQEIYHPEFGDGDITEIKGEQITVAFDSGETLTFAAHMFNGDDILVSEPSDTALLDSLKAKFAEVWQRGAAWRLEVGEILYQIKEKCDHGQWGAFLDEQDLPRSTADDYIRRYKNEAQIAEVQQNDTANPEPVPDPESDERKAQITVEQEKREGRKPTFHPHELRPKLKNLATEDLELYQIARKQNPHRVDVIWLNAFYEVIAPLKEAEAAESDERPLSVEYEATDEDIPTIIGGESAEEGESCSA